MEFKSNHTRLMCIQCHHCKGLGAINRAHPMTIDQNCLVSFTIQNKLRFINADGNTYEDDKWYNCATGAEIPEAEIAIEHSNDALGLSFILVTLDDYERGCDGTDGVDGTGDMDTSFEACSTKFRYETDPNT